MKRLKEIMNDEFKMFKSYHLQYINTENDDENILSDVILMLQKLQSNKTISKHFNDDLIDIIMYFTEIYKDIKLTLDERLEILKNENIKAYNEITKDFNSYAFNNPIYVGDSGISDENMKHSILNDLDVPRFRNAT